MSKLKSRLQKQAGKPGFEQWMEDNFHEVDTYMGENGIHKRDWPDKEFEFYEEVYVPRFGRDLAYENGEV